MLFRKASAEQIRSGGYLAVALTVALAHGGAVQAGTRGSDQLFWVPTLEQALIMAQATGRPVLMLHGTYTEQNLDTGKDRSSVKTSMGKRPVWAPSFAHEEVRLISHPKINRRLQEFICVRLDEEQMRRHQTTGTLPTPGYPVLLNVQGNYLEGTSPHGKRYSVSELIPLLDRALYDFPGHGERKDELRLDWFWCNPKQQDYSGCFDAPFQSRLDRKPLLTVSGPLPAFLQDPEFLRRHLRQFIWTRGKADVASRITIRQFDPATKMLADLPLERAGMDMKEISQALDRAWLEYMKVRPLVARSYTESWLKPMMETAHREELAVREQARNGTLLPPGRD